MIWNKIIIKYKIFDYYYTQHLYKLSKNNLYCF